MPAKVDWEWHGWMQKAFACPCLAALKGKPVSFLEIGVFQGGGAVWLLENVLTHPDAKYVGVDPFALPFEHRSRYDIRKQAQENLDPFRSDSPHGVKAHLEIMPGHLFAAQPYALAAGRHGDRHGQGFDVILVDGSHHAFHVLRDSVAAWPLLKVGGFMVWDDYHMIDTKYAAPPTRLGVDGFVNTLPRRAYRKLEDCSSYAIEKTNAAVTDFDHEDGAGA